MDRAAPGSRIVVGGPNSSSESAPESASADAARPACGGTLVWLLTSHPQRRDHEVNNQTRDEGRRKEDQKKDRGGRIKGGEGRRGDKGGGEKERE
jgi:hypothetical protein